MNYKYLLLCTLIAHVSLSASEFIHGYKYTQPIDSLEQEARLLPQNKEILHQWMRCYAKEFTGYAGANLEYLAKVHHHRNMVGNYLLQNNMQGAKQEFIAYIATRAQQTLLLKKAVMAIIPNSDSNKSLAIHNLNRIHQAFVSKLTPAQRSKL